MHGRGNAPVRGLDGLRAAVLAVLAGGAPSPALATPGPCTRGAVPATGGRLLAVGGAGATQATPGAAAPTGGARARASDVPTGGRPPGPAEVRDRPETGGASGDVVRAVAQAQKGDPEAFGVLYDEYVTTVYRYVLYRVGSAALAEDLTSETFLRALRRIGSFTWQGRDFGAWLVTIARNLVTDHFKSGRYRLEVATSEMLDADRAEAGPEDAVVASLTHAALLDAVKRLSSEQQECVVLRFLQGMSVSETARIMGKNDGAVKTLQYRAVRALARLVPQELR
jgi:RNA polymerase sigma-70 factor, ECF subfamily